MSEISGEVEVPDEQPAEGKEKADEQEEIDKNARIAELEDENAQLKEALSDKEQKLADKDALVKELEARIKELEGDNENNAKRLAHLEEALHRVGGEDLAVEHAAVGVDLRAVAGHEVHLVLHRLEHGAELVIAQPRFSLP